MDYRLTKHALKVLEDRGIALEWMERTLRDPEWVIPDPGDQDVHRHFRRIPEFGNRVLRVAVNVSVVPKRVISVFFDRSHKGHP